MRSWCSSYWVVVDLVVVRLKQQQQLDRLTINVPIFRKRIIICDVCTLNRLQLVPYQDEIEPQAWFESVILITILRNSTLPVPSKSRFTNSRPSPGRRPNKRPSRSGKKRKTGKPGWFAFKSPLLSCSYYQHPNLEETIYLYLLCVLIESNLVLGSRRRRKIRKVSKEEESDDHQEKPEKRAEKYITWVVLWSTLN